MRLVNVTRPTDGQRMTLALPGFGPPTAAFSGVGAFISEWEESAQRAMQAEPRYFARWYTVKSIALVGVTAALVYVLATRK